MYEYTPRTAGAEANLPHEGQGEEEEAMAFAALIKPAADWHSDRCLSLKKPANRAKKNWGENVYYGTLMKFTGI